MSVAVSVRLPEKIIRDLEVLASTIERSKTFIVRKAIESYLKKLCRLFGCFGTFER